MREILFRGKRTDTGEWGYGSVDCVNETLVFIRTPNGTHTNVNMVAPSTLGQYTGLKDKTGRRIFEGDIVELRCSCDPEDRICAVTWDDETARFVLINPLLVGGFIRYDSKGMVVIGNVHDNPDLLEVE